MLRVYKEDELSKSMQHGLYGVALGLIMCTGLCKPQGFSSLYCTF